jgi:hypothetical protein
MGSFLRIDVLTGSKKLPVQATIRNFAARSRSIYFLHAASFLFGNCLGIICFAATVAAAI